jgi:hypothetical protein
MVFVISGSYSQIIELFPMATVIWWRTKLLGPKAGLVSGSALVLEYMLTITISCQQCRRAFQFFVPFDFSAL